MLGKGSPIEPNHSYFAFVVNTFILDTTVIKNTEKSFLSSSFVHSVCFQINFGLLDSFSFLLAFGTGTLIALKRIFSSRLHLKGLY